METFPRKLVSAATIAVGLATTLGFSTISADARTYCCCDYEETVTRRGMQSPTMALECVSCSEIPPCPKCGPTQMCTQSYPSNCGECPKNVCVDAGPSEAQWDPAPIIGGIVGGFFGLLVLLAVAVGIWWYVRRRNAPRDETCLIAPCESPDIQCAGPDGPETKKQVHYLSCISEHTEPEEMEQPFMPPIVKTVSADAWNEQLYSNDENPDNPFAGFGADIAAIEQCVCGKQSVRMSISGTASAICESCAASLYTSIPLVRRHVRFVSGRTELGRFPSVHKIVTT